MRKCPICEKGEFKRVNDIVLPLENKTFKVKGDRCDKCCEEILDSEEVQRIFCKPKVRMIKIKKIIK